MSYLHLKIKRDLLCTYKPSAWTPIDAASLSAALLKTVSQCKTCSHAFWPHALPDMCCKSLCRSLLQQAPEGPAMQSWSSRWPGWHRRMHSCSSTMKPFGRRSQGCTSSCTRQEPDQDSQRCAGPSGPCPPEPSLVFTLHLRGHTTSASSAGPASPDGTSASLRPSSPSFISLSSPQHSHLMLPHHPQSHRLP